MSKIYIIFILITFSLKIFAQVDFNDQYRLVSIGAGFDTYNTFWSNNFYPNKLSHLLLPQGVSLQAQACINKKYSANVNVNAAYMRALYRDKNADAMAYSNIQVSSMYGAQFLIKYYRSEIGAPYGNYIGLGVLAKNANIYIPTRYHLLKDFSTQEYYVASEHRAVSATINALGAMATFGFAIPISAHLIFDLGVEAAYLIFNPNQTYPHATTFMADRNLSKVYYRLLFTF
ncbi:MAG: hypothetical protein ACPGLV_09430 [Bacteroidia bacterium]